MVLQSVTGGTVARLFFEKPVPEGAEEAGRSGNEAKSYRSRRNRELTWELYCDEIRPYWLLATKGYGFTVNDIDWSSPADLEPYRRAYELEMKNKDTLMHNMGLYNKMAFDVVMANFGAGLAGKRGKAEYLDKPIYQLLEEKEYEKKNDRKEYKGMTKEEKEDAEWKRAKNFFNSLKSRLG